MPMRKILVVDDSPTERYYLSDILKKHGCEVLVAENAEAGLAQARQQKPDLVLMDVVMPGMNGFQATRALARDPETRAIPVILCTTKDQETDRVWGMRQGAVAYLVKPVQASELLARIDALGQ
jgi:twitching motility two-component system response regulator PilH